MEGSPIPVLTVPTAPYEDQRPSGGGGLRRPTGLFEGQRNYLPNFIQSVLSSIDLRDRQGCTMVVGSDGRYFSRTATEIVVQMAAANGVSELPGRPSLPAARRHPRLSPSGRWPPATVGSAPTPALPGVPRPPFQGPASTTLRSPPGAPWTLSCLQSSSTLKFGSAKLNSIVVSEHTPVLIPDIFGQCKR